EKGAVRSLQRALVTFSRQKVTPRGERGQAIEKQSIARDASREMRFCKGRVDPPLRGRGKRINIKGILRRLRMTELAHEILRFALNDRDGAE
ncbi:MAG: hypothetical protein LBN02_05340, partial [Oscillospiraceae bacterium]|nr:hypothetical protein [Oscillospiraceae bacterium]